MESTGALACDPMWLSDMQAILLIGLVAAVILTAIVFSESMPAKPKTPTTETCKLHARPVGTCPPGSHDEEPDA